MKAVARWGQYLSWGGRERIQRSQLSSTARALSVACLLALAMLASGFGPPTLIESGWAATPVSPGTLKLMVADRRPEVLSKAAVIIDFDTGMVVYEKNSRARRAPASTTKMMTALVTLENARLDEVVVAGPNVLVEPSIIGLDPGDRLTVEQMLYGLLLPSGNDAAIALAEHVGGSVGGFAGMMNAKAAQLGMKDSQFMNPHGLDADGHYSSAYDLALLTRAAMRNPVFEKIVATRELRIQTPIRWLFANNNRLLSSYQGADGVKTGYTDDAGRCLAFSATRNGHRAISVVLDSGDLWNDSSTLLDYFFANYSWDTLRAADIPLSDGDQGGELRRMVARSEPKIVYPAWQRPYLRWALSPIDDSATDGGIVANATYYLFGMKIAEIKLFDGELKPAPSPTPPDGGSRGFPQPQPTPRGG